jgi:hypothetical protein
MTKARDISKLLSTANGKIAGENLDVSFENITDTGTEGTRVATGTSAQRGSTAGQIRFNSETGLAEYYTGTAFKSIDAPPTVSSVGNNNITQTQIDSGYDLSISGSGFSSGATVKFIGNDATEYNSPTVTVNSDTSITARVNTSLTNANEPYDVKVINVSGLANTLADAFNVDGKPAWQTASGTIATINDIDSGNHATVSATDPENDTVTYAETGGTILSTNNFTLNSSTGVISGDPVDVASPTTHTFTLRATSGTNFSDRIFNIIVNPSPSGGNLIDTYSYGGTTYRIHKFTSTGNFVLPSSKTVDYLIIGGGGGAGHHSGGGGGAGGLVWLTSQSLSSGTHQAVIGGGGASNFNYRGSTGDNSTFNSKIALGGGGGGNEANNALNGGSGGGGSRKGLSNKIAGSTIQNSTYGYGIGYEGAYTNATANGGDPNYAGYAGGGAGGTGTGDGRIGGIGSNNFINSSTAETTAFLLGAVAGTDSSNNATTSSSTGTLYIAGGGGGSEQGNGTTAMFDGGLGGGGKGNSYESVPSPESGLANTGSGAGGQSWHSGTNYATTGGSGIVIVRYAI